MVGVTVPDFLSMRGVRSVVVAKVASLISSVMPVVTLEVWVGRLIVTADGDRLIDDDAEEDGQCFATRRAKENSVRWV